MPRPTRPSRRTAVAIRHVAFEDLGTLEPALRAKGYRIEYRDAGVDPIAAIRRDVDLLVVLGGPIGAYEEAAYPFLREELRLVRERLEGDRPTLGICLGAQIMARALGAKVFAGSRKELGWERLALTPAARRSPLAHLDKVRVLHWHGDTFEMPEGATHLAASEAYPHQAFSWGRHGLALQFHAEVRQAPLERWYIGHACEIASTGISVASLRAGAAHHAAPLEAAAAKLWRDWLAALD